MNAFVRWWKFNLVGATGMALQLASLACLNRISHGHYLFASAIAVELAVLNNFAWHRRYTWADRREHARRTAQCIRFHLSNGLVSLIGNLLLMRMFVFRLHLHVMLANIVSIAICSIANFALSDRWAFRQPATLVSSATPCSGHAG